MMGEPSRSIEFILNGVTLKKKSVAKEGTKTNPTDILAEILLGASLTEMVHGLHMIEIALIESI